MKFHFVLISLVVIQASAFGASPMRHFGSLEELFIASGFSDSCAKENPKDDEYPIARCPEAGFRIEGEPGGGIPNFTIEKLVLSAHVLSPACFDRFYDQKHGFTLEKEGYLSLYTGKPKSNFEHCMGHVARPVFLVIDPKWKQGQENPIRNRTLLKELDGKFLTVEFDSSYKCAGEVCKVVITNVALNPYQPSK